MYRLAVFFALALSAHLAAAVPDGRIAVSPKPSRKIAGPQKPEDEKACFVVPEGFEVELVAAEPLLINPVTMTVDEKGRIYVSESHTYRYGPRGSPLKPFTNPIVRLDPLPGGKGYKRVLVAEGFADPVMGIAVKGGKLWATANNYLYVFDLSEDGKATNRKAIVIDKNKAWNPFGMFVLEWGPDGLLYMSVGNHNIDLRGPNGKLSGRGGSGIICRMKPDGRDMERLVHGLRVPYSFDYDPFGQLWLLSNGEGNPNRFVRVIEGVDYHCYSRGGAGNEWLAGRHPLAPPCLELPRGANTQLLRYYGAAYPASYQGSLLLCNWGAHGFNGPNRAIFRYLPDARGDVVNWDTLLACSDPYFRPSHIALDPDGNLLVSDWYGRDDESDKTGRIWRVRYVGKEKPPVATHKLASEEWAKDDYALAALGSPSHLVREKAAEVLVKKGNRVVAKLGACAAGAKEPLGASGALWALERIGSPEALEQLVSGTKHPDWRVRRLALRLMRRHPAKGEDTAAKLLEDDDEAVRVEAALSLPDASKARAALVSILQGPAARDAHLRYEAAAGLARVADVAAFEKLLGSKSEGVRLAGLIAADVACYESLPTKPLALEAVGKALVAEKDEKALAHLLSLARLNADAKLAPALAKLLAREDVPATTTAQALLLLKSRGAAPPKVLAAAGKRLLDALARGAVRINSPAEAAVVLDVLEAEGPTPQALAQLGRLIESGGRNSSRAAAHALARKHGPKAAVLARSLWPRLAGRRIQGEDALEAIATLARIEEKPDRARWKALLSDPRPEVSTEAVRWWRSFKGDAEMVRALVEAAPQLIEKDAGRRDDLAAVLSHLGAGAEQLKKLGLVAPAADKEDLGRRALQALAALKGKGRQLRAAAGRMVFERNACVKCHTAVDRDVPLAPSLKAVARGQKPEYLVESVLYPSKIIKTGFETEQVRTKGGIVYKGLVKDDGKVLLILDGDREVKLSKADVEAREVLKLSLMPEGQEKQMSRAEFVDLLIYLASLK